MSERFDVIVIGGGVIGCSVAYHLGRKGLRVAVLERGLVGGQASRAAAGILAAQEESRSPGAFFDLCIASRAMFDEIVPEVEYVSHVATQYRVSGAWRVAETEEERKALLEQQRWQEEKGFPSEWWSPKEVLEAFPRLDKVFLGALYCPKDGCIDSQRWVRALMAAARNRGVRFIERVIDFEFLRADTRILGVRTPTQTYAANHVVVTAGAWTQQLLANIGVGIPCEPVKGQAMLLEGQSKPLRGPVFIGNGYFSPRGDGRLLVGATVEHVGVDLRTTLAARHELADWAMRHYSALKDSAVCDQWAGLRPGTIDGWPVMGPVSVREGLSVCTGHFRKGVLLSAFSGRYMADGIAENRWDPRGETFRVDRFLNHGSPACH